MIGIITKFCAGALMLLFSIAVQAQDKPKNSLLLTGIVLDAGERKELPYVNVRIKDKFYGTATDVNGYFSLFVNPGDTLIFSYVGYQEAGFIMPYQLSGNKYSLLQLMVKDTVLLDEVVVFPWPDYDDFVKAFLDTQPPSNTNNLITEVRQNLNSSVKEAELGKYYLNQQRYQRLFQMHDIFPSNNFLDPSRWADFIRDLRTETVEKDPEKY